MVADGNRTYGDHFVMNREILNHYVVYLKLTECCRSIIIQLFKKEYSVPVSISMKRSRILCQKSSIYLEHDTSVNVKSFSNCP